MTTASSAARDERPERQPIPLPSGPDSPACPKCGGRMWDNRMSKRNPKAPDFKCRSRACDGVLWPGQARNAIPVSEPRRLAAVSDIAEASSSADDAAASILPILRRKYLELT